MMRLEKKTAIVTGAGSGIGERIAQRFAEEGASVIVNDVVDSKARQTADAIVANGGQATAFTADITNLSALQAMVSAAKETYGGLTTLVNNAGVTHANKPMLDVGEAEFDRIFSINVKAIYLSALAAVPLFREQGSGSILNIASATAARPRPGLVWYSTTKGAVVSMTKSMAVELAADRIRVNALSPVATDTPLLPSFLGEDTPEKRAGMVASIPLGRLASPEDIAHAAVFLASDEASLVTGVNLGVDGGRSI